MSRDQHAGQNHNIKISNKCFERVKQFKYLETTLTDQNSLNEEIKNSLLLFGAESCVFQLPKQNIKIKVYKIVNLSVIWVDVRLNLSR
jgi:hypothetical protein